LLRLLARPEDHQFLKNLGCFQVRALCSWLSSFVPADACLWYVRWLMPIALRTSVAENDEGFDEMCQSLTGKPRTSNSWA
jgi:hypothetical protein